MGSSVDELSGIEEIIMDRVDARDKEKGP